MAPSISVYDYVIVGAGSAGAVMAARLSEDPSCTVLLLEAGGESHTLDEVNIPAAFTGLFKTRWDWNYSTTPQKQLNDQRVFWPRMKALGGCSAMNAMIYIRGNKLDFDTWRDQYGAAGWGYDDVLPYFVKAEKNSRLRDEHHGSSGPLHVEDRRFTHELSRRFVDSAVASGLSRNGDFNGADQEGAGQYQVTCHKGRRWSTYEAYLAPAMSRPNLTVMTHATATRVELDEADAPTATGVTYRREGSDYTVQARREVVLSGGAINSPHLLLLSGIGPSEQLLEHGITPRVKLAGVGANMQDHPVIPIIWHTQGTTDLAEHANVGNMLRWKLTGSGPLASNVGEAGAFFRSRQDLPAPDIQIHVAPTGFYDNGFREPKDRVFTAGVTLVSVASRGRLRLRSADPEHQPELEANYFDDQSDLDAVVAGMRRTWDMCRQGPLGKLLDRPWGLPENPSDEDFTEYARTWTQTLYHPVATCAMGAGEESVVDPQLRVRGVHGLRVVDASVMPSVTRGNTHAPTVMIAEKAADDIRRSA